MNRRREEHKRPENYHKIREHFGLRHQKFKLFEELGEFIAAVARVEAMRERPDLYTNVELQAAIDDVSSEHADVLILLRQFYDEPEDKKDYKMRRTINLINEGS